jgi:hypothetical protein
VVVVGVVVVGVVVAGVLAGVTLARVLETLWPGNAFAAISASAPVSTTIAATVQRVTAAIRRRPASRATAARRTAVPTAVLARARLGSTLTAAPRQRG